MRPEHRSWCLADRLGCPVVHIDPVSHRLLRDQEWVSHLALVVETIAVNIHVCNPDESSTLAMHTLDSGFRY